MVALTKTIMPGEAFNLKHRSGTLSSKDRVKNDLYPTPPCAVKILLSEERFNSGTIWECACGNGDIVRELKKAGLKVFGTDLSTGTNFLKSKRKSEYIITNPPFSLSREFILKGNELATKKFAILLKSTFFNTPTNVDVVLSNVNLKKIISISGGIPVYNHKTKGWDRGGFFTHAWYVFSKGKKTETVIIFKKIKEFKNEQGI